MRVQVFVDESQRKHYIICAAIISQTILRKSGLRYTSCCSPVSVACTLSMRVSNVARSA